MKTILTLIATLIGMGAFAQESDTATYYYGTRWYNSSPCGSCPLPKEPPKEGNFIDPYQFGDKAHYVRQSPGKPAKGVAKTQRAGSGRSVAIK